MGKTSLHTVIALLLLTSASVPALEPALAGTWHGKPDISSPSNFFGDPFATIPCAPPGGNNSWAGSTWANNELILLKNVYPDSAHSQFYRINPQNGAVIAEFDLPFAGYVMGAAYDGSNLWVVQYSPVNVIHQVSLIGQEISSFAPSTAPYSCRNIAWDNFEYFYVGANHTPGDTRLYKMTTTGAIVQVWSSGSAVGWYMGSIYDREVPSSWSLITVDSVGNALKRLDTSGASVVAFQQTPSVASSPDRAVGLAYDGENLWHNGAFASQGVIWHLDEGLYYYPFVFSLTPISPPVVVPAQGGSFDFTASVLRCGGSVSMPYWVWARIRFPNGQFTDPTLGPVHINLPLWITISRLRRQNIPASFPSGQYLYLGYLNSLYSYPAFDSEGFYFTKSASLSGSPWMINASCTGEPFPGEEAVGWTHSVTSEFSLSEAFPNPFNPRTTINYQLSATSHISLWVYDLAGRLVTTLVDGWQDAGSHQVTFDGSKLSSGLYFVRLQAGDVSQIRKIMLVK